MAATPYPADSSLVADKAQRAASGKIPAPESHKAEAVSASELTQHHALTADPWPINASAWLTMVCRITACKRGSLWMRENGTSTGLITVVNSSSGASAGLIFLLLPAANRLQHHLKTLLAEARIHVLAQHRHLADDLLHPQRRERAFCSAMSASVSTIIVNAVTGSCGWSTKMRLISLRSGIKRSSSKFSISASRDVK